jgi:predicted AlkP superfamily pyrophosphatase or phosphodiesterase
MKTRLWLIPALLGFLTAIAMSCAPEYKGTAAPGNPNNPPDQIPEKLVNDRSQMDKPYVVLISIDGYRHDYTVKYHPPTISAIASGVQAKSLKPSYPSLTFPNHYSIVTGLLPTHHGIVSNFFYDKNRKESYSMVDGKAVRDGSWYGGTPLWRAASKNGMLSATVYWVGSEAAIDGGRADYLLPWTPQIGHQERVEKVIEWLSLPERNRPHFVSLYFSAVDSAGHKGGPNSAGVRDAIMDIDSALGKLYEFAQRAQPKINIVIVSDHGMRELEKDKYIELYQHTDLSGFKMEDKGAILHLYSEDQALIEKTLENLEKVPHMKAYRRADLPVELGYNDSQRVGDIVIAADIPYYIHPASKDPSFVTLAAETQNIPSTHGWDNGQSDMHGIFYAYGPNFKKGMEIPTFHNIHIYPMMLELLGLPQTKVDGEASVLRNILIKR